MNFNQPKHLKSYNKHGDTILTLKENKENYEFTLLKDP